ncbi:MAG: hypothetical protein NZM18_12950 [Thermoflexales bacterium]|nr:hypothetical protein [Thermoflexales bacterium]MDW8350973.1 hypothetical protein [Anaerolineae bacterium]
MSSNRAKAKPLNPRQLSEALEAFVDTLLPGDSLFPAASQVGAQHVLAERLRAHHGNDAVERLVTRLAEGGKDFVALSSQERARSVRRLERDEPTLFAFVRAATYFAYYQHPSVVRAVRKLGHDYNDAPQPQGYAMPAFDPEVNAPKHRRGFYKKTEEMAPVDTSALDDLLAGLPRYPRHG